MYNKNQDMKEANHYSDTLQARKKNMTPMASSCDEKIINTQLCQESDNTKKI